MSDTEETFQESHDAEETPQEPQPEAQEQEDINVVEPQSEAQEPVSENSSEPQSEAQESVLEEPQTPKVDLSGPVIPMGGGNEAVAAMEDAARRKAEKLQEELDEYKEMRKEEKLKEAEAIEELKRKKLERQAQRAEEEKRLAELRVQEDARRKAEEEERKRRKAEEEEKRKAERERKRREAEKRKGPKTPNYKIVKKHSDGTETVEEVEKKTPQKSKEQLEQEKRAILAQRITPLEIEDSNLEKLVEKTKELHEKLWNLISNKYDLEERFKRQQYDMVELAERARQMSKVKKRGLSSAQVDESYDRLNDKHSNAPPPILLASKFERDLDRRTWEEKLKCYSKEDYDVMPHAFYAFSFVSNGHLGIGTSLCANQGRYNCPNRRWNCLNTGRYYFLNRYGTCYCRCYNAFTNNGLFRDDLLIGGAQRVLGGAFNAGVVVDPRRVGGY